MTLQIDSANFSGERDRSLQSLLWLRSCGSTTFSEGTDPHNPPGHVIEPIQTPVKDKDNSICTIQTYFSVCLAQKTEMILYLKIIDKHFD
jgi:hypothetical protein